VNTNTGKLRRYLLSSFLTRIRQSFHHCDHFRRGRVEIKPNDMYRGCCPSTGQLHTRDQTYIVCFATVPHREVSRGGVMIG
jgi:hypothetical protein